MYTVLDTALNVVGFLSNKGRGANDFWGDTISQQIADTQDILGNVDLTVDNVSRNIDVSGNTKNWNHTLSGISFNNTPVGAQVENGYYLLYKDDATNRHYLMQLTSVSEKVTPGGQHYKTATGVNAALYDFSRMIVDAKEFYSAPTGRQTLGSLQNILKYLLGHAGWNVNLEDYNFPDVQYSVSDNTSVQSVLQDVIKLFDVDVDAYVTLTPQGRLAKRVVEFRRTMGTDSGVTIRYGKNMTDMTREALSDSIYTKLYVQGANSLKISSVNNGLPYIVDEAANNRYNPAGASSSPETFREGTVINSMITDARSLLAWGKKQLQALNHPRINYTISSIASTEAGLGDTIRVQDLYASQQILLTSRVIQKTFSFANPTANTLVLGEYSSVIGDKTKNVDLIAKLGQVADDITVVSEAAVKTQVIAKGAASIASQASSATSSVAHKLSEAASELTKNQQSIASQASAYTNSAVADANSKAVQIGQTTAQNAQSALNEAKKAIAGDIATQASQASAYTDSAVAEANSKAVQIAQTTAQNAQNALNEAKKDFTNSYASQASQTASMASAVTSKANQYASQAKSEAIAAATSADGVVRTEFKKTTDSMTATIQQNKSDADGKITKAQTTATQALDGLSTKVSQTEYNAKTGQLQTDLTTTTQTANQAATDIVSIKQKDGKQDEKMNSIVSDVNGTKQTVSDLQTVQGKQSGDISTLQQRADGFDATVTKVNNLSVGNRNYILNSKHTLDSQDPNASHNGNSWWDTGWVDASIPISDFSNKVLTLSIQADYDNIATATSGARLGIEIVASEVKPDGSKKVRYLGNWRYVKQGESFHGRFSTTLDLRGVVLESIYTPNHWGQGLYIQGMTAENISVSNPKLEIGNVATDWTPAPEDLESATAKAQLTADQATVSIDNYKTDADGRIRKAQADIIANANAITQKVSQSDYNTKTGELTTSVSKAQQTADTATQTIGTYKETNDKRVAAAETNITANADAIKLTASKTELNQATGKLSGDISTLQQRADGFDATVTKVNNLSVGGRNLYINATQVQGYVTYDDGRIFHQSGNNKEMSSDYIPVLPNTQYIFQAWGSLLSGQQYWAGIGQYDSDKSFINRSVGIYGAPTVTSDVANDYEKLTFTTDANTYFVRVSSRTFGNYKIKFEQGNIPTDWSPAPEDLSSATAKAQLTADQATVAINNYKTDADGRISKTQADIKVNANAITQKVSQSDYNTKTGELTNSVSKAQQTADSATLSINNYKTDADGRISKAQADIKINADAISTKVAKTDYDKKTGDLTTSVDKAQRTADGATETISKYKESNDQRIHAAETNIQANSDAILQTVSKTDFDKATGKISGDISTLQQRADGFEATVTKVNNLAVGGRNLLLGTGDWSGDFLRWDMRGTLTTDTYRGMVIASASTMWTSPVYHTQYAGVMQVGKTYTFSTYVRNTSDTDVKVFAFYDDKIVTPDGYTTSLPAHTDWTRLSTTFKVIADPTTSPNGLRWESNQDLTNGQFQLAGYKLEEGNVPTDWSQAPEDIDNDIAQVKLTADGLYETVNNPTTGIATRLLTAEGSITTVQSKTNELTSKLTQTASAIQASVETKTDKTTVLSLFSDNFETGIKGHTGAIISGINGDVSGMQIVGKHIVLTGDTTIQPGFTLTVDHLVGNTAKFIKTNWESVYSNIQIDGDGITIAAKDNGAKTIFENGDTHWWSSRGEDIGYIGITTPIAKQKNADYMTIGVNGWQTTTKGDKHYNTGASDFYGGDGIMFGITDANTDKTGVYRKLMTWESSLTAGYLGIQTGWHAWEQYEFHEDVKVDGSMNVGGDINLGWTLRKNGTGFYPAHFNNIPGIHIVGTNSGFVINESANKFYVVMRGHWNEMTMTGKWGTGTWDN